MSSPHLNTTLPPPLPSRDRGVTSPGYAPPVAPAHPLDVYYSHLQKHVRVVKRKSPYHLPIPVLGDYATADGASTQWAAYLKAWLTYLIESFASDRIDDELEPFAYDIMKSGCDRLYRLGMPLMAPMQQMVGIYEWHNVPLTGGLFSAYFFLWWMDLLAVVGCLGLALFVITVRLESFAELGVEMMEDGADDGDADNDGQDTSTQQDTTNKKKNWQRRLSKAGDLFSLSYTCDGGPSGKPLAPESKSVKEWRTDITMNYGPTAQLLVLDIVDKLERMKNLVTWKRPAKTRALLVLLVVGAIGLFYIPYGYITKSIFFWLGMEFFVLQYMRTFYPRYRRLFNIIDWVLWGVPNDAQYAMEVIRLNRHHDAMPEESSSSSKRKQKQPLATTSVDQQRNVSATGASSSSFFSSTSSTSSSPRADTMSLPVQDPAVAAAKSPTPGDRSASLPVLPSSSHTDHPPSTDSDTNSVGSDGNKSTATDSNQGDGKKKYGKAISTTATLATMMASTAVGQFKQLIDDKLDKDEGGDKKSIPVSNKDKNCPSYGCMYQGSIPGRLVILDDGFQFKSSRMTGAKVFVDFAWQDLVRVKKTKSMDAFIFHTNGLDIHLSDGQVLSFENVIKRDECFTHLVSSGEHW